MCKRDKMYTLDIDEDEYGDASNYGFGWGGDEPTKNSDADDEYGDADNHTW